MLTLPRREGNFTVDTNACGKQVGCLLPQQHADGIPKPIGYWSRSRNDAEYYDNSRTYDGNVQGERINKDGGIVLTRPFVDENLWQRDDR